MRLWWISSLALALAACGAGDPNGGGGQDGGGGGGELGANLDLAGAGVHKISAGWVSAGVPAVGADLCIVELPQIVCGTADANGVATVSAPDHALLTLRFTIAGAYPIEQMVATSDHDSDLGTLNLAGNGAWDGFLSGLGLTRDPMKGDLIVSLRDYTTDAGGPVGVAGATVTMNPASGVVTYTLDDGTPSTSQPVTTDTGHMRIFNVTPGAITLDVMPATGKCVSQFGWNGAPSQLQVRVDRSVRTVVIASCD